MSFLSRRSFLQTVAAALASFFLPRSLRAGGNSRSFFLHTPIGDSWAVGDPVAWCLANAQQPILVRASKGLRTLTPADGDRIIRLVVRRCNLNVIEIQAEQVVVHFWGQHGQGDLRPFFKQHGLARHTVHVTLIDRKRETSATTSGDAFLFGEPLAADFPVEAYERKWRRRRIEEPNDGQPAPCSFSNYCWPGIEQRRIPWRVLKAAWRHENAPLCQNCDKPTVMVAFGYFVSGFYKRAPNVVRICPLCRSKFEDHSPWDGQKWILANLDAPLLPVCDLMFGQAVPWTAEG